MADLLKLCKRKKLKQIEKNELINNPFTLNNLNENLLHVYAKNFGFDVELLTQMIENKHDINNVNKRGQTIIHSCMKHCRDYKKIKWLIEHNFPISTDKYDVTNLFLYECLDGESVIDNNYLDILKLLLSKNLLKTDLTTKEYSRINPLFNCNDIKIIKWIDSNFKLNYDYANTDILRNTKYKCYKSGVLYKIACNRESDLLEFVCKKININTVHNIHYIYDTILTFGTYVDLEILYENGYIDSEKLTDAWKKYIDRRLESFHNCVCINNVKCYDCDQKMKIIYGLINKKLVNFPVELIKSFQLEISDIDSFIKDKKVKPPRGTNYSIGSGKDTKYASNIFKDDYSQCLAAYINKSDIISGIENLYDRRKCEKIREDMLKKISLM